MISQEYSQNFSTQSSGSRNYQSSSKSSLGKGPWGKVSSDKGSSGHGSSGNSSHSREQARKKYRLPHYTIGEEIANSVTHGIGVLLSVAALVLLIIFALRGGGGAKLVSAIIFGVTLIVEYLASTLYHAIQPPFAKRILRVVDHSCIYLLIAGSYTPFSLVALADKGGYQLVATVWAIAACGIAAELFWHHKPKFVSLLIYLAMGWLIVFKLPTLISALNTGGLSLLVAGGLCYSIGAIFYALKRIPYMHSIWHVFVIAGSVCHFLSVLLFVY